MLTAPNSEIYLLKSPIELDNNNQLNFASASAQQTYFQGLTKINITGATFQRKDGTLRWPGNMESLLGYNYCMYRNKSHGNKWFYAFVVGIEWASENSSIIKLKTDVWQTYQFDIVWHPSFVEREHVNDDTFGKHTVPEGIEYGEYIVNSYTQIDMDEGLEESYVLVQVSDMPEAMFTRYGNVARVYNGVPQGCWLIGIPITTSQGVLNYSSLNQFLRCMDSFNKANAVVSLFIVPGKFFATAPVTSDWEITNSETGVTFSFTVFIVPSSLTANTIVATQTVAKPSTIDGYTPKNNKCFCSPYNYIMASNNGGETVAYAYELFNGTPTFTVRGAITQGCDIKMTPTNYRFTSTVGNHDYSLNCGKFPLLSWNSDYYLNWVAVNQPVVEVKSTLSALSFGLGLIGGMLTGDFSGTGLQSAVGLGDSVANTLSQVREAKMTPDSARGNLCGGDINYTLEMIGFTLYRITVRAEYIKQIDDYFSMYGYKVNTLKQPNVNGRAYWNYVKTVGCNITGDVPQEDLNEIKGFFNRGITIWHDATKFLDYSQNNIIVS